MNDLAAEIYLGAMSGTSMDGLDLVAVRFDGGTTYLLQQQTTPYPSDLKLDLQQLVRDSSASINQMCELDTRLGHHYARQINDFIDRHDLNRQHIRALGSHGQTIRHAPDEATPYTLQIGDPNIIAAACDITVVGDFRRRDLALGGQGAPLTPAFHRFAFHSPTHNRAIINIGGIANLTLLPQDPAQPITGFDSGPGNTLIDYYCQNFLQQDYDHQGAIAREGVIDDAMLQSMLRDAYFNKPHPKSTGTDYFSPQWLGNFDITRLQPADALATLTELTAASIAHALRSIQPGMDEYFICGGGAHNDYMMQRLAHYLSPASVQTTSQLGIHPDWVEAVAFAWLARQTINLQPGNEPTVTNAQNRSILGAVFFSNGQK